MKSTQEKYLDWLYVIIYLGLILRFCYPFFCNPLQHLWSDPARHYYNGDFSSFGKTIESIFDPPLPQLLLMLARAIFPSTPMGMATYSGLLCALAPWPWYRWAREVFATKTQALFFIAILIFLPSWIGIYGFFMDEAYLLPALGAALWLSWRAKRKKTAAALLIASCAWALTIALKLSAIIEAVIVIPWLLIYFLKNNRQSLKTYTVAIASVMLVVFSCFGQALWNFRGLGTCCLFPPLFNPNNRAAYLSGTKQWSETFISHGKIIWRTGFYCPNSLLLESLDPFSHWITWRKGELETIIDCDHKFMLAIPVPHISWRERLKLFSESAIYFFFNYSWPDDLSEDLIQAAQVQMRWIWSLLTLSVCILAVKNKKWQKMPVILCLACASLYLISDSVVIEGRYRKPWEPIAIAAFLFALF